MINEILADLKKAGSKSALMAEYAAKQQEIRNLFGGSVSDVPYKHPDYDLLSKKIMLLGAMNVPVS